MGLPDTVEAYGPPPNASGNPPPIATFRMTKKPWCSALFQVVASTRVESTLKVCRPSTYQRSCSGLVLRSYSIE